MSGSFQSHDYVPGMSGLKIDLKTGEFELNSARIQIGTLPSDPQPITITAGDWSDYDLPANAIERYAFIGAELAKIPAECRDSAEFTTEDISLDRDGSDYRTTLTYVRQETQEEAKARHEKAKVAGSRINLAGGVLSISHDGALRAQIGGLQKDENPAPFIIVDGVTYISDAAITEAIITSADIGSKLAANWSLKMQVNASGQYVAAGMGLGLPSQFLVSADRFAVNGRDASEILRDIASKIGETSLGQELKEQIERIELIGLGEVNKRLDELEEKQGAENRAISDRIHSQAASLQALIAKRT